MSDHLAAAPPPFSWRDVFIPLVIFGVVLWLFWYSPITDVGDSKYTLLLTQNLLSRGSFALDGYFIPRKQTVQVAGSLLDSESYQIEYVDGHPYYYFPPGSSILSAPFVLIGDCLGYSVVDAHHAYSLPREIKLQAAIASLLMAFLAVIFYFTARLLLPSGWSACLALGGALGTQVWSTASRALWAHTWGISLLGAVLYLLLAQETGRRRPHPVLLATLLSWTYFVRPTNSIFIIGITVYLILYQRALFIPYAVTGASWFVAFAAYSWTQFGKLLPGYYQANRLETNHFREAFPGNLISPSRGALVFVPVTLFVLYLVGRYWRHQPCRPLVWLTLAVSAAHLAAVSCFTPWWGGWCYGSRYTTELVPWFVLLAALGTRAALSRREDYGMVPPSARAWRATLAVGSVLLLVSVWINGRGANAAATAQWNEFPVSINDSSARAWDWRYPQILAGIVPPPPPVFPAVDGRRILFGNGAGKAFEWDGWSPGDPDFTWSQQHTATLVFTADDPGANRLRMCFGPYLHGSELHRQRIVIRLNDQQIAAFTDDQPEPREYVFSLPPGALRRRNVLTFMLPDAASPKSVGESDDDRPLGIALRWMELKGKPAVGSAAP